MKERKEGRKKTTHMSVQEKKKNWIKPKEMSI